MNSIFPKTRTWLAALLLTLPLSAGAQTQEAEELAALSRTTGIAAENLEVLSRRETTLPELGLPLVFFKVRNTRTDEILPAALTPRNEPVDYQQTLASESQARWNRLGNLYPAVLESLEAGATEPLPVLLKLAVPEPEQIDKRRIVTESDREWAETRARELDAVVEAGAESLFRALLREQRLPDTTPFTLSGPFVATELPAAVIRNLSHDLRIAFIGPDREPAVLDFPTIPESLPATLTQVVHNQGLFGGGVKIAVLEGGTINQPQACFNIQEVQNPMAQVSDHVTKSVGIIANRFENGTCDGNTEGYAPRATILMANKGGHVEPYEWARRRDAHIVTMSWHYGNEETNGDLHSRDIYFDYWSLRWPFPTVFTSAGNQALSQAFASGKGFNILGVGNIENDGDADRCNSLIFPQSSWKDPISPVGDREVPALATPGSRHAMLGSSFGGTSAATPATASIASLIMEQKPELEIWPEAIRAILQATANFQGADGQLWSPFPDGKDGAGLTNASAAVAAARVDNFDKGLLTEADFTNGLFNKTWSFDVFGWLPDPQVRVAFTWNSKVADAMGVPVSSELNADLDLFVRGPNQQIVASSLSFDGNVELVDFVATEPGTYTIEVRGFGALPSDLSSWFGVAWNQWHFNQCP